MATMSVSGVVSGMDWDSMIDEIITNAARPAQVQVSKRQNLTNKKSLFEEMKVTMNSLQSSLTPLKLPSTYKAKQLDIERIDTNGSYKGVLTATVNADAEVNVYDLVVNQLARAQTNRSKQITSSDISPALSSQGLSKGTMYINMAGQKVGIDISSTDSLQTIKSKINNTVKTLDIPVAVTASVVDNRLIIRSDSTGLGENSMSETLTYNVNGRNTITAFNVSDSDLTNGNFVIRSGSTQYTYGKDYDLVNGNEIRWNQYEETDNVKLGDSVKATYKIAKGDTYESKGTYGTSEAKISGFSVNDNGTLSSRLKIVDDDGYTYTYGTDFTLDDSGNVEWIEEEEATTKEPSGYTVSYTTTSTESYSISGDKTSPIKTPESYTVSYDKVLNANVSTTLQIFDLNDKSTGDFPTYAEFKSQYGITDIAGTTTLDFNRSSTDKVEILVDGSVDSSYSYGSEFTLRKASYGDATDSRINNATLAWTSSTNRPSVSYTVRFTHSYSADTDDSSYDSDIAEIISAAGTDTANIKITGSDGTVYEQGTHYDIENGEIVWKIPNDTTDLTMNDFAELQTKYAEATKVTTGTASELSTVTLVDGDGVLRTYVDPDDPSILNMTAGGEDYVYGRDYVLRVNDSGTGYRFQWLVEDSDTITDANTVVATYAAHKNISTSEWKTAPTDGTAYIFGFDYDVTTTETGKVSSTQTDKSLETIFGDDVSIDDYSSLTITNGSTAYTYGTDYTIDDDGNIEWLYTSSDKESPVHPDEDTGYTLIYDAFAGITSSLTYNDDEDTQELVLTVKSGDGNIGGTRLSYEQILSDTGLTETSSDSDFAKYFTLTDNEGVEYEYGTDYRIISSYDEDEDEDEDSEKEHSPLIEWLSVTASGTAFTLSYTGRSEDTLDIDVTRSNTDAIMAGTSGASPLYSYFDGGTSTITSGTRTYYEGIDYEIIEYETIFKHTTAEGKEEKETIKNAAVEWKTGTNSEWYYPGSNASYTINLTTSNGNSMSFSGVRSSLDSINLNDYGFTSANGSISSVSFTGDNGTYTYDLTGTDTTDTDTDTDEDDYVSTDTDDAGNTVAQNMRDEIGLAVTNGAAGGGMFYFNWVTPARTANADLPGLGDEITADYTYQSNTFTLSDDSDGSLLKALELDQTDSAHYTAAQDAELVLDGETITRESNDIGESYGNELIKGMTIHLKGTGEVSLDVSHDAEQAVESIQTFVDTYNDLMTWMNTRMTESAVDEDIAATIDSDDFRMRWGLLHGNSLLRNTKAKMRSLTSQNFTFSFTQRSSAEEIYGTMGYNGLRNDATLRLRINSKFVDVSILPTDTLQDIIDKINDDSEDGAMHDIYYDDEGKKLAQPLLKASIENDRLVITSTGSDTITMSGTSAMNALKMNYTYKGLYQLGIATTSTDYGKSGELEFDTSAFMEALEDNADEVQELMLMFANDFDTWTKSMLNASASGETSGTLTREIENLDNQIKTIDEYLEKYQERLDRQEESLRTRYANSETQFAKLSQQANSIAAILNQLNGYTNNNSSSSSS